MLPRYMRQGITLKRYLAGNTRITSTTVTAYVTGPLAIWKNPESKRHPNYEVIHVPTGYSVGTPLRTLRQAKAIVSQLLENPDVDFVTVTNKSITLEQKMTIWGIFVSAEDAE